MSAVDILDNDYSDTIDIANEVEELLEHEDYAMYRLVIRDILAVLYSHGIIIPVRMEDDT